MFIVRFAQARRRVAARWRAIVSAWHAWRHPARVLSTEVLVARCPHCREAVEHADVWLWYGGNIWHRRCLDAHITVQPNPRPLDARDPGWRRETP